MHHGYSSDTIPSKDKQPFLGNVMKNIVQIGLYHFFNERQKNPQGGQKERGPRNFTQGLARWNEVKKCSGQIKYQWKEASAEEKGLQHRSLVPQLQVVSSVAMQVVSNFPQSGRQALKQVEYIFGLVASLRSWGA